MVAPSELGPAKRLDLELRNCHIDKYTQRRMRRAMMD